VRVERLKEEYDIAIEWRGVEIHPEIPTEGLTLPPEARARFGGMSDKLRAEAQKANLPLVVPEMIPKSRRALEASEYAREQGKHGPFHENVFRKFYGEGQNIGSWDVLRAAAEEVGIDADEMQQKTESRAYAKLVNQRMNEIFTLGATGVPLYIFNEKYAVVGLQPYDAFEEVMAVIAVDNEEGV
jgi:predicted DsbA family dithiol-disulfide isomerase